MSAAPKIAPKPRLCRSCECEALPDQLDCLRCIADREREFYSRERRMRGTPEDDGPDDANDPSVWPDGMGRLGWRR